MVSYRLHTSCHPLNNHRLVDSGWLELSFLAWLSLLALWLIPRGIQDNIDRELSPIDRYTLVEG